MTRLLALVALVGGVAAPVRAATQEPGNQPVAELPGAHLTVRLVTAGPGLEVWNRFGHNGLWIHDAVAGTDRFYDYGNFDFAEPGFITKFAQGHMRYWMGAADANLVLRFYASRNRTLTVQELALSPAERLELQRFLERNLLPENRYYDYDYYYDNCSTRVRDAIDLVLGGAIARQLADTVPGASLRLHTDRLLAPDIWAYTGTKYGLGPATDRPASRWVETFIPMKLMEYLRTVTVPDGSGGETSLVASEEVVFLSDMEPPADQGPSRSGIYLLLGLALGSLLLTLGLARRRSTPARWGFVTLAVTLSCLGGLAGALLTFLWCCTDHTITAWNSSILQANPVMLLSIPLLLSRRKERLAARWLGVLAGVSVAGLIASLITGQANIEVVALMLPLHLSLWAALRATGRHR